MALLYPFSRSLRRTSSFTSSATAPVRGRLRSRVRASSSRTTFLAVFWLCNSKQASPNPTLSKRRFTTSSAAIFSDTNKTERPFPTASAIMLVMVWDFPVPGGPWTTRFMPWFTSISVRVWEPSASTTL